MQEAAVEARLRKHVKAMGGQCVKLMPTVAGVPDRLVLLPGGKHFLIELKTEDGYLHPAQYVWHKRSEEIGHPVVVLRGSAGVDEWVAQLKAVVE